jgi:3-oxoacyl-[acyl-carrier protein] reductase
VLVLLGRERCADDGCCVGLPVARSGRPEEVAETVLFMVNNGFLTRKILPVDGGFHPH